MFTLTVHTNSVYAHPDSLFANITEHNWNAQKFVYSEDRVNYILLSYKHDHRHSVILQVYFQLYQARVTFDEKLWQW